MNDFINSRINNRYELRERIGAGGMARVFTAWDTVLERIVAIKVLHEHLADDPNFKERFIREARFIARLNHPNIVQVYDFDITERDGFPLYYMVMSYVPGRSLRDLLEEAKRNAHRLPADQILRIASNTADALDYAHQQGTVHRDVKPGNVLITQTGDAVLTDFGIARMIEGTRFTQDGISTGTPLYMSPEQATGQPGDAHSDLYSLGVMLFEMITGQTPYEDAGSASVMMKHLSAPIPTVSEMLNTPLPQLDAVMTRALAKKPDDRYPTGASLIADLYTAFSQSLPLKDVPFASGRGTLVFSSPPTPLRINTPISFGAATPVPTAAQTGQQTATTSAAFLAGVIIAAVIIIGAAVFFLRDQLGANPASPTDDYVTSMTGSSPMIIPAREAFFTSTFDVDDESISYWVQGEGGGFTQRITPEGSYELTLVRPQTAEAITLMAERPYANVGIEIVGTLDESSAPASAFGVVFRYQDADNYHVFGVDGLGRYSIWIRQDGEWRELRGTDENWTRSDFIQPSGGVNRLTLEIFVDTLTGYVNSQRLFSFSDSTLPDGQIGIYFATDDGGAIVRIDEFSVYPSVRSMTGD